MKLRSAAAVRSSRSSCSPTGSWSTFTTLLPRQASFRPKRKASWRILTQMGTSSQWRSTRSSCSRPTRSCQQMRASRRPKSINMSLASGSNKTIKNLQQSYLSLVRTPRTSKPQKTVKISWCRRIRSSAPTWKIVSWSSRTRPKVTTIKAKAGSSLLTRARAMLSTPGRTLRLTVLMTLPSNQCSRNS